MMTETARSNTLSQLTPYLQKGSVETILNKFGHVPPELNEAFTDLRRTTILFYQALEDGYVKLREAVGSDADDPRSAENAYVIYAALSHTVLTSTDTVTATITAINQELEANSRPRPVSDDPATEQRLLANAKAEVTALPPSDDLIKSLEQLFHNSLSKGNYSIPFILTDSGFMEDFVTSRAPHVFEAYRTKLHPKFLRSLASSKTRLSESRKVEKSQ